MQLSGGAGGCRKALKDHSPDQRQSRDSTRDCWTVRSQSGSTGRAPVRTRPVETCVSDLHEPGRHHPGRGGRKVELDRFSDAGAKVDLVRQHLPGELGAL